MIEAREISRVVIQIFKECMLFNNIYELKLENNLKIKEKLPKSKLKNDSL